MKNILVSCCAASLLLSCSSAPSSEDRTAVCRSKFERSQARFQKGEYWQIKDDLDEILTTCQGTGFAEESQFMLAESHFRLKEWIEARGEYTSFVINFPSSPYAETAGYRRAVSSFNMSYSDSRDESNSLAALKDFENFRSDYPSSPLLDSVSLYLDSLQDRQAEREFLIARLYWRMNEPQAAVIYLKEFLEAYPKNKRWNESILLLIDCYTKLEQFDLATLYLERARSTKPENQELQNDLKNRKDKIASAQKEFQERLLKEQKKKLQIKEDET